MCVEWLLLLVLLKCGANATTDWRDNHNRAQFNMTCKLGIQDLFNLYAQWHASRCLCVWCVCAVFVLCLPSLRIWMLFVCGMRSMKSNPSLMFAHQFTHIGVSIFNERVKFCHVRQNLSSPHGKTTFPNRIIIRGESVDYFIFFYFGALGEFQYGTWQMHLCIVLRYHRSSGECKFLFQYYSAGADGRRCIISLKSGVGRGTVWHRAWGDDWMI